MAALPKVRQRFAGATAKVGVPLLLLFSSAVTSLGQDAKGVVPVANDRNAPTEELTLHDTLPGLDYGRDIYAEAKNISQSYVIIDDWQIPLMGLWVSVGEADARLYAERNGLEFTPETAEAIFEAAGERVVEHFQDRWAEKYGIPLEGVHKPSFIPDAGTAIGVTINGETRFQNGASELLAIEGEISAYYGQYSRSLRAHRIEAVAGKGRMASMD